MYTNIHSDFIKSHILDVLKDGLKACDGVGHQMESFPMKEYYLQSLFLKMTGALEQKMKCICWQLATDDYKYRYEFLNNKSYGECSSYKDKNGVYQDLISCIKDKSNDFSVVDIWKSVLLDKDVDSGRLREEWEKNVVKKRQKDVERIISSQSKSLSETAKSKIESNIIEKAMPEKDFYIHLQLKRKNLFLEQRLHKYLSLIKNSSLSLWDSHAYLEYSRKYMTFLKVDGICRDDGQLLDAQLQRLYKSIIYEHRNRCAHNTISYQQNLPSLDIISKKDYRLNNYFSRFAILILIDEVFIVLYNYYEDLMQTKL